MPHQMSYPNSMWMRAGRWVAAMGFVPFLCAAAPPPSAWVPVRWPWADTRSLELLTGTPVNCLLLRSPAPELVAAARARGVVALAVVTPGGEANGVDGALAAKVDGIVLEGEFPEGAARSVGWQRKDHNCAGHRLVIFILHLDEGFAGSALADVVRRTLALEHYQVEHRGNLSSRGNP